MPDRGPTSNLSRCPYLIRSRAGTKGSAGWRWNAGIAEVRRDAPAAVAGRRARVPVWRAKEQDGFSNGYSDTEHAMLVR